MSKSSKIVELKVGHLFYFHSTTLWGRPFPNLEDEKTIWLVCSEPTYYAEWSIVDPTTLEHCQKKLYKIDALDSNGHFWPGMNVGDWVDLCVLNMDQ